MCWFYSRMLIVYQWKEMGIEMRLSRRNLSSKLAPGGFWTNILRTQCNIIKISQMIELINHLEFYTKQSKKKNLCLWLDKTLQSYGERALLLFQKGHHWGWATLCDQTTASNKGTSKIIRQCDRNSSYACEESISTKPGEAPRKTQVATEKKISEACYRG